MTNRQARECANWAKCGKVWQSVAACGHAWQRVAESGRVWQRGNVRSCCDRLTAMTKIPVHIWLVKWSRRTKRFITATKTMQPPRRSIQMDASMFMSARMRREADARSKRDGIASRPYVRIVIAGSASILA